MAILPPGVSAESFNSANSLLQEANCSDWVFKISDQKF